MKALCLSTFKNVFLFQFSIRKTNCMTNGTMKDNKKFLMALFTLVLLLVMLLFFDNVKAINSHQVLKKIVQCRVIARVSTSTFFTIERSSCERADVWNANLREMSTRWCIVPMTHPSRYTRYVITLDGAVDWDFFRRTHPVGIPLSHSGFSLTFLHVTWHFTTISSRIAVVLPRTGIPVLFPFVSRGKKKNKQTDETC